MHCIAELTRKDTAHENVGLSNSIVLLRYQTGFKSPFCCGHELRRKALSLLSGLRGLLVVFFSLLNIGVFS